MLKRCAFLLIGLFLGFVRLESGSYLPHILPGFEFEKESKWEDPFFFIKIADCQFGLLTTNKDWSTEISLLEQAVVHINRLKPRFVILCGDMVHQPPHNKLHDRELADYKRVVSKIDPKIRLICVCGNHDVWNTPEQSSVLTYEKEYKTPHYFAFWVDGVQCLVLNSSLIWDPSKLQNVYKEQYSWFQQQLGVMVGGHKPPHRFVFQHHPWFVNTYQDADGYGVIPKVRRMPFLEMMASAGVSASFSGHLHRNAYGSYKGVQMITSAAVAVPLASGLRVVRVYHDHFDHAYYTMKNVPQQISL